MQKCLDCDRILDDNVMVCPSCSGIDFEEILVEVDDMEGCPRLFQEEYTESDED